MDEAERLCDRVAIMDHGKVIALGTPNELIATIGGEEIVEFAVGWTHDSTQHAASDVVAAAVLAIPGVESHRVDASVHQLSVDELHTTVPRIFAALEEKGLHLYDFRTHSATLEDVFVRMTGRNLRDE
jgi:ABC-2 type transport system ATP-binding protein